MKNSRRKLLLITIFLASLLSLSAYASQVPNVQAAEPTIQEKGVSILSNVAALDLSKYAVTPKERPQYLYYGVIPEDNVGYTLESDGSKLSVSARLQTENCISCT